ncbi:MAG: type II secretion system protein GspN [Desulfosalsimonadaceae bacterium]
MTRIKKIIAYALFVSGAAVLFLYVLFPSDTVKTYIEYKLAGISPDTEVHIEKVQPGIPPRLSATNVYVSFRDDTAVRLDRVDWMPDYLSLISSRPGADFTASVAGGRLNGTVHVNDSPENRSIITRMQFADIELQAIPLLVTFYPGGFSGTAQGNIEYSASMNNSGQNAANGSAVVEIHGARITIENNLPGLDDLTFSRINADADLQNNRITINQIDMEGSQFSATGKGSLTVAPRLETSRMDLNGTVQIHPELIRSVGPLLPRQYLKDGKVSLRITGTVTRPRYSFR